MSIAKDKINGAFAALKGAFGYTSPMASPRVTKVIVSTGIGSITDKNKIEVIVDRLTRITGQKPASRTAKKSIAGFKSREGETVGYQVTLRGKRMYDFLDRFLHVALPRTRDFRGVSRTVVDEMGNMTIGVKEHTVFPETADEELKDIFGLAVTVVTTADGREEAVSFFEYLGVPFRKEG